MAYNRNRRGGAQIGMMESNIGAPSADISTSGPEPKAQTRKVSRVANVAPTGTARAVTKKPLVQQSVPRSRPDPALSRFSTAMRASAVSTTDGDEKPKPVKKKAKQAQKPKWLDMGQA